MQKDLAPRGLEQLNSSNSLKKFGKYTVIIKYVPEYETHRFVGMINFMVKVAGWNFKNIIAKADDRIRDGVAFETYGKRIFPQQDIDFFENESPLEDSTTIGNPKFYEFIKSHHTFNVSDQLMKIFKENNVDATYGGVVDTPKENTIYMEVGLKPNKFNNGVVGQWINNMTY